MSGMMAFVSCANENAIVSLHLDEETGALREVARTIVPGTEQISPTSLPMALSHDRRTLHAALRSPPYPVTSFAINAATGELSRLGGDVLPEAMAYLATDRTDRFLLSASYGGGLLAVNESARIAPSARPSRSSRRRRRRTASCPTPPTASSTPPASAAMSCCARRSTPPPGVCPSPRMRPSTASPAPARATSPSRATVRCSISSTSSTAA